MQSNLKPFAIFTR